jgi:hypothetical protein
MQQNTTCSVQSLKHHMPAEILADCCGACGSDTNLVHELLKNVSSVSIKAGAATYEQLLLHAWPVHIYGQGRSKLEFSFLLLLLLLLLLLHAWSLLNCNSPSTRPFFLLTIIRQGVSSLPTAAQPVMLKVTPAATCSAA